MSLLPPFLDNIVAPAAAGPSAQTESPSPTAQSKAVAGPQLPTHVNFAGLRIDTRYIAPIFITVILLAAQLSFGVLESYDRTLLAIGTSVAVEIVLGLLIVKKMPHLASAYISGISVGILVRSPYFWPYALTAAIATTSKYVIRVKGRHIWNPSNFAIAAMLLLAHEYMATLSVQWDNRLWAMLVIWALGSFIIWNLKRFHICATYVLSYIFFTAVRSAVTGQPFLAELAPITGPMYQLFVFFMITDPKTTVTSKRGQCAVAFFVAFAEMVLRLNQNIHAPYYALFLVGPIANLIDIWWQERRAKQMPAAVPVTA
jgi:Na+-translocating ferredoxin:NAD+ oxidoreductase RnfD subunit